jgi:hypothetical protein
MVLSKYANRQDKLEQRQAYKLEAKVVERFGRGREDKLAEVRTSWRPRWSRGSEEVARTSWQR